MADAEPSPQAPLSRAEIFRRKLLGITINPPMPICQEDELRGCTEEQVAEIQASAPFPLPDAYKTFLRMMGRGAGEFMGGHAYSVFYPRVIGLDAEAKSRSWLLSRFDDPQNCFVFLCYDGEVWLFFKGNEGDDPPIYELGNERRETRRESDSLWDTLELDLWNYGYRGEEPKDPAESAWGTLQISVNEISEQDTIRSPPRKQARHFLSRWWWAYVGLYAFVVLQLPFFAHIQKHRPEEWDRAQYLWPIEWIAVHGWVGACFVTLAMIVNYLRYEKPHGAIVILALSLNALHGGFLREFYWRGLS